MARKIRETPKHFLKVAGKHLKRVKDAWEEPDWSDLGTYGLYCLEALIRAAALHAKLPLMTSHWQKADQAVELHQKFQLPNIRRLLKDLNTVRKAEAYGDIEIDESDYDPEDIVSQIETYFDRVSTFCK